MTRCFATGSTEAWASRSPWPTPPALPFDLHRFADRVKAAAQACPSGRYGDSKVFIVHVWRMLHDDPDFRGMDFSTFKQRLAEANNARLLDLSRADLVQAMDPEDVQLSELLPQPALPLHPDRPGSADNHDLRTPSNLLDEPVHSHEHRAFGRSSRVAFCSALHPGLFHAVAYGADIWRPDPLDVRTIHEHARQGLEQIVNQVCESSGLPIGRILLLLGDSGSGKTHLLRAFRNQVHSRHQGYCGYLQMTTFTDEYSRYVLNNLIEALDRPYFEPETDITGLIRLSNALVESLGNCPGDVLDAIREGETDQGTIDRFVDEMANRFICDRRFHSVDVYLVQALLYLQSSDPRIKARVLKYLRCEDLTPQDRQFLGGMVPCTYADAPDRVLQRFGELMWILEKVPLVLCADQLEDMFDMKDAPCAIPPISCITLRPRASFLRQS